MSMRAQRTPARTLMVQGTGSGVGKSLLVTALCRILRRRGIDVVPFKAQNMSNNAAVTADGGEIGRAQALQAIAAGVEPTVEMNPILLKPLGDRRSSVVVLGRTRSGLTDTPWRVRGSMLRQVAVDALHALRGRHELVLIEGAGSPAEINLRDSDLVNMGLARQVGAPVVLVADIDSGGAFAALYGTWGLLDDGDRALLRAFVLNKFRGDPALLAPAPEMLEERTGVPFVGIVPWHRHLLPEEDGAGDGFGSAGHVPGAAEVTIGVVALPHASNIDDFDALRAEAGVRVVKVEAVRDLWTLDALVLPGTRNTPDDLCWLEERGLADGVRALARSGVAVVGLCGGYQMLGEAIEDPHGVEAGPELRSRPGLGLLALRTTHAIEKSTRRVADARVRSGPHLFAPLAGEPLSGYEIHHGRSVGGADEAVWLEHEGRAIGHARGSVWGCYLHGVFESDALRGAWLASLGVRPHGVRAGARIEAEIDAWADVVEASLDVDRLLAEAAALAT
jgi:adenosylcobyric acid synthase